MLSSAHFVSSKNISCGQEENKSRNGTNPSLHFAQSLNMSNNDSCCNDNFLLNFCSSCSILKHFTLQLDVFLHLKYVNIARLGLDPLLETFRDFVRTGQNIIRQQGRVVLADLLDVL